MSERFLSRWSRLKTEGAAPPAPAPEAVLPAVAPDTTLPTAVAPAADTPAAPTLADVAALGADSDYSAFVARGVDSTVRRLALKKLFADPHFNLIDGLDIYMGDYNKADPMPEAMLAALESAKGFLFKAIETDDEPVAESSPPASAQGPA